MSRCKHTLALAVLLAAPVAMAGVDLGTQGATYPIREVDLRLLAVHQASMVDWEEIGRRIAEEAREYRHPGERSVPVADEPRTVYFRPSWTVPKDIHMPVREGDAWHWRLVYRAGEVVYPIDHMQPARDLLIFDGRSEQQTTLARRLLDAEPYHIAPIATAGDLPRLTRELGTPVYAVQDWHFQIGLTHVPSRISAREAAQQGHGHLRIDIFALPFEEEAP